MDTGVLSVIFVLADGVRFRPPEPSDVESAVGLICTATVVRLFFRSLLRGNGVLGRGGG